MSTHVQSLVKSLNFLNHENYIIYFLLPDGFGRNIGECTTESRNVQRQQSTTTISTKSISTIVVLDSFELQHRNPVISIHYINQLKI